MRNVIKASLVFCVLLMLVSCGSNPIKKTEGQVVYTQIGLWSEGGEHATTNYSRRDFIPVNTKVEILDTSSDTIRFKAVGDDDRILLVNIQDYTHKNIKGIYQRYFGESTVDLSGFGSEVRKNILSGRIEKGMSKDAVRLARGYPPAHRTSTLEDKVWIYWQSRFDKIAVTFEDNKIVDIKD